MNKLLDKLFSAQTAWVLFFLSCFFYYGLLSIFLGFNVREGYSFLFLSVVTFCGCIGVAVGRVFPLPDYFIHGGLRRIVVSSTALHAIIWGFFLLYCAYAVLTADAVPLVSMLAGADELTLNEQRGSFLKARTGYESALIYISTVFVSVLLPFSLSSLFLRRSRWRFLCFFIFFTYSLSFMQKALFLNVVLPLLYVFWYLKILDYRKMIFFSFGAFSLLFFLVAASVSAQGNQIAFDLSDFFSAAYTAKSGVDYLIWRIVGVPLFSAADTLHVFFDQFSGEHLFGATSSFFSSLFFLERINLERIVFAYQWSWNDTANTNSFYMVDSYVNFGFLGVVVYSFMVGQIFRLFAVSDNEAFKSIWPVFCINIFNGSLVPTLLGNGFLLLFLIVVLVKER